MIYLYWLKRLLSSTSNYVPFEKRWISLCWLNMFAGDFPMIPILTGEHHIKNGVPGNQPIKDRSRSMDQWNENNVFKPENHDFYSYWSFLTAKRMMQSVTNQKYKTWKIYEEIKLTVIIVLTIPNTALWILKSRNIKLVFYWYILYRDI